MNTIPNSFSITEAVLRDQDVVGTEILVQFVEKAAKEASLVPPDADLPHIPTVS